MISTSDLSWNEHVNETVKKASERLYFLVQLKRARLPRKVFVLFYVTCRRTILVYAAPVFFYALPKYLRCELERVQKRAMSIIFPSLSYMTRNLRKLVFQPFFFSYCEDICDTGCGTDCDMICNAAPGNKDNKLNKLLTEANKAPYSLRNQRHFALPKWRGNVLRTLLFCHRA